MAEGVELSDLGSGREEVVGQPGDFIDLPASDAAVIRNQEDALKHYTGSGIEHQRRELLKT